MGARIILLAALVFGALTASAQGSFGSDNIFRPYGEGLPLPWPFPWAKECPVKWQSISGRYAMMDSSQQDVDLKISILTEDGLKVMRITRYNAMGGMVSDGFSFITENQRSIRVYLRPLNKEQAPLWANIKLYHSDYSQSCEMSRLVPILSIVEKRINKTVETQYRLVRRPIRE